MASCGFIRNFRDNRNALIAKHWRLPTDAESLSQIEDEIDLTEQRLAFWRQQESLQTNSELGARISPIVDGYERQRRHLEEARLVFDT